jgi:hypothetical protein
MSVACALTIPCTATSFKRRAVAPHMITAASIGSPQSWLGSAHKEPEDCEDYICVSTLPQISPGHALTKAQVVYRYLRLHASCSL